MLHLLNFDTPNRGSSSLVLILIDVIYRGICIIYIIRGFRGGIIGVFLIFIHLFSDSPANAGVTDHFQVYTYLHLLHL